MLKKFLAALVALVVSVLVIGMLLPSEVVIERDIVIDAPRRVITNVIQDTATWPDWTVWNTSRDPTATFTPIKGGKGVGAGYSWAGEELGNGQVIIDSADVDKGVHFTTTFNEGKYVSPGWFTYSDADANGTLVTWAYKAEFGMNPIGRIMGKMMDGQIGPDLEGGLQGLKVYAEAEAKKPGNQVIDAVEEAGKQIEDALEKAAGGVLDAMKDAMGGDQE